jgi:esterase
MVKSKIQNSPNTLDLLSRSIDCMDDCDDVNTYDNQLLLSIHFNQIKLDFFFLKVFLCSLFCWNIMPPPFLYHELLHHLPNNSTNSNNMTTKITVFIHGMLGRSKNLRGFASQFVDENNSSLLVDLRGHGNSPKHGFPLPNTVSSCAQDVLDVLQHLHQQGVISSPHPKRVIGHSFGGKTALGIFEKIQPEITWVLDSVPHPLPNLAESGGDSVIRLMKELNKMSRVPARSELVEILTSLHFSKGVATWMTTNVVDVGNNQHEWAFNLKLAQDLIDDYCAIDMFPLLESLPNPNARVRFVRAERNKSLWKPETLQAFQQLHNPFVKLLVMSKVGHFLHAEKPKELYEIINNEDS